ncbi:MAG: DedA family protein [Inquilinaceae bacterium]
MFYWVTGMIEQTGYVGIAILMFLENVFPPIPSELIMPLAGFTAARGDLALVPVVLAGSVGSLAGALLWYYIGKWLGDERLMRWAARHGRWLTVTPRQVERAIRWFDRHGTKAVLIGRLIPAVRTLISVPAGIADMPLPRFLLFSALGTVAWTALLAAAGFWLKDGYMAVSAYVNPVSNLILAAMVLFYVYRVATFRRRVDAGR